MRSFLAVVAAFALAIVGQARAEDGALEEVFLAQAEPGAEPEPQQPTREAPREIEEITVTGSYIRGTATDGPSPVSVISREDLEVVPVAELSEVIKDLSYNVGATWQGSVGAFGGDSSGRSNVNLRGLGPAQTLILLDGKRNTIGADVIAGGQTYVNIEQFPKIIMERVEVLKEGAAATYGSDAVAGVVNFITRRNFEGFEMTLDWTDSFEADSFKRGNIEAIWGFGNETTRVVLAGAHYYTDRYRAGAKETSYTKTHFGSGVGESTFANPGSFLSVGWDGVQSEAFQENGIYSEEDIARAREFGFHNLVPGLTIFTTDPDCAEGGGKPVSTSPVWANGHPTSSTYPPFPGIGYRCSYSFIPFFDLQSERYRWNAMATFTHDFSEYAQLYADAVYYRTETDHIGVSPSFPILNFARDAQVPASNPGNFLGRQATYFGRPIAKAGGGLGIRSDAGGDGYSQKYVLGLKGDLPIDIGFGEDWHYDVSVLYNRGHEGGRAPDQRVSTWNNALWGFGGPDCAAGNQIATAEDVASGLASKEGRIVQMSQKAQRGLLSADELAAQGNPDLSCFYWNPFASAHTHPDEIGNGGLPLKNRGDVYRWFTEDQTGTTRVSLGAIDAVLSGSLMELPAGSLGVAAGVQWREEHYDVARGANTILEPGEPADTFIFIPGGTVFKSDQDVFAAFAELDVPVTDTLEVNLAVRHEDYGHRIGKSVDPKLALRWQAAENLVFRTSISTTFHAPALNQQFSERTALISTFDADARPATSRSFGYVQVPLTGNPNLQPEEAVTFNAGFIASPFEGFEITADYYRIKFDDALVTENHQAILDEENALNNVKGLNSDAPWCKENGLADSDPSCFVSFDAVFRVPDERDPGMAGNKRPVVRIQTDFLNASSVLTDGIDLTMSYDWNMGGLGDFRASFEGTHIIQYEFDGPGVKGDISNLANFNNSVYPLPKIRFSTRLDWMPDELNRVSVLWKHVAPFEDDRTRSSCTTTEPVSCHGPGRISQFNTWDLIYARRLENYPFDIRLAVTNVFDQDPPFALRDLNYLPRAHDGLGRLFLASMSYHWE